MKQFFYRVRVWIPLHEQDDQGNVDESPKEEDGHPAGVLDNSTKANRADSIAHSKCDENITNVFHSISTSNISLNNEQSKGFYMI
jgi:hypothetical protein